MPAGGLGFQEAFNYCDASPRSAACSGEPDPGSGEFDQPAVDIQATSVRLTGNFDDHVGPSAWFQPTMPLSTLTIEMTWQTGFPVYQTWFAAATRTISGTLTRDGTTPEPGVEIALAGPDGSQLASTTTGDDGSYFFTGLGPADGYTVAMTTPDGLVPVGPQRRQVDLAAADVTDVDFDLTRPVEPPGNGTTAPVGHRPAPTLPATGNPAGLLAVAGAGLVVLGAVAVSRRRRLG